MKISEILEESGSNDGSPPGTAKRMSSPLARLHSPHSPQGTSGKVDGMPTGSSF